MKIREGVEIADTLTLSPLDIMKVMYDGDIPDDDEITDMVGEYAEELAQLLEYTLTGWENRVMPVDAGAIFSSSAIALTFALGVIAGREESHD